MRKSLEKWAGFGFSVAAIATVLTLLDSAPAAAKVQGWLGYMMLLIFAFLSLRLASWLFSASDQAVRLAWFAAGLRLVVGVGLMLALPVLGYAESEVTEAGYFYYDPWVRDRMAWQVAAQNLSIWDAFSGVYPGDQYGGLMALSAFVYRLLSPDVHRPSMILILTASAAGWGVLATWAAARLAPFSDPNKLLEGELPANGHANRLPILAAAIMAFFPEGVILGATHMREAFLIPGLAVALFGMVDILHSPSADDFSVASHRSMRVDVLMILGGLATVLFFQPPVALAGIVGLGGFYLIHEFSRHGRIDWRTALLILLAALVLIGVIGTAWERMAFGDGQNLISALSDWLLFNLQREGGAANSDQIQRVLGELPLVERSLALSVFGLLQPFLPAAVFSTGNAFWRVIGGLRAVGWYLLIPMLVYALWVVFRSRKASTQSMRAEGLAAIRWLSVWLWAWSWFTALRAGGDQWDNPRYRVVFIGIFALVAAWIFVRQRNAPGLRRIILVEGSMVLVFCIWYIGRYLLPWLYFDFVVAVSGSLILSAAALALDWVVARPDHPTPSNRDRSSMQEP